MDNYIQNLADSIMAWAPKVGIALLILIVFMILARILKGLVTRNAKRVGLDEHIAKLLARAIRITLILFGVITALGTLGIDISALVAGLGLTGFALGFALKDTISNLLSGILILLYRPFTVGDHIIIAGNEGAVVSIDLRYTELRHDDKRILIPNSKLFTDPITVKATNN